MLSMKCLAEQCVVVMREYEHVTWSLQIKILCWTLLLYPREKAIFVNSSTKYMYECVMQKKMFEL